ncbi:FG-GAP repeat domain-containing protein [Mangrovimonas spongiae]|uniref:T9SS C-terminal target domain-containing protein n=1 Tax=Mangrovimonas spongiae TaxID=2494697 RepID=A0A3R9NVV1_9FLAO|nr:VCBS repeat-containing protein [Mangrovimonas spongiae]RSK38764.1 T9SS C-terminal target domain-containing protein [Mangrovimonas spongiae]
MKKALLFLTYVLSLSVVFGQNPFGSKQTITTNTGNFPKLIASGNIDNDSFADIVIGTSLGNTIEWYKNNGNGTFTMQPLISSTLTSVNGLVMADLDGDNDQDIIATSESMNKLVWFENTGNGNFSSEQLIANGLAKAGTVKAGDINNDGTIDLAVSVYDNDQVVWYANNGNGSFGAQNIISNISSSAPCTLDLGDYDQDGDLDVVIGYREIPSVKLFNNNLSETSAATFTVEANNVSSNNFYITDVSFGDIDNNGDLEIVKVDIFSNTAIYDKQSDGTFNETVFSTPNSSSYTATAKISDLDDNSLNDVALGYSGSNTTDPVTWFENSNPNNETIIDNSQNDIFSFTLCDFDNDGDLDMATISSSENHLNWFENNTYESTLTTETFYNTNFSIFPNPANSTLNIKTSNQITVVIYDTLGRQVITKEVSPNNNKINIESLKNGIYLATIKDYQHTFKFIKN